MRRPGGLHPLWCGLWLLLLLAPLAPAREAPEPQKNLLIIGASSLASPLHEWVSAFLASNMTPMNVEPGHFGTRDLDRRWNSGKRWDYIIMDAWQLCRGGTKAPEFPDAVSAFVKRVRSHSPECQIILWSWWLPGRSDTNEDVMRVFGACVEAARQNGIWVATTGPAFMEARFARPDLRITVSARDAHPGLHGTYLNACSLFTILTGANPAGLPSTLKVGGEKYDIAADDAKYLQELAWSVFQRELQHLKPKR